MDASTLSAELPDSAALQTLLGQASFEVGTGRSFVGRAGTQDRAVTRVLVFGSAGGARTYLEWLGTHASQVIGGANPAVPLDLPGAPFVFVHRPGSCCPKDATLYLAAWQRDRYVFTIVSSGRLATRHAITLLASKLDRTV